ncbi:MAG: hypothetical protein KIT33_07210 [Candidatus Kapabacteria bacterium]|nr:hypothetical protein [Ignavibacteriota bacterium]MCW5884743.1 hypothetical protein [Candidatus Kapabacteria bacterium]
MKSQGFDAGSISGNVQIEAQSYTPDSLMGAPVVDEKILSNAFVNLIYRNQGVEIGFRYENYLNPILGFDARLKGQGVPYRYITYREDKFEITGGDFYEQFGSGLILRAYQEVALGIDNAIDGFRFKLRPVDGVEFTGLIGQNRVFWAKGEGIIRGGNLNIELNDLFPELMPENYRFTLGGSVVSKYQPDRDIFLKMPENVLAYSARAGVISNDFAIDAEYAYKYNDPNATNRQKYNIGQGLIVKSSFYGDGIGVALNAHWIDNMDMRSDRNARAQELFLNFIPPLTKQHAYALTSLYPLATQFNNEAGIQLEVTYQIPRGSAIGGKYGTMLTFNYSDVFTIDTNNIDEFTYNSKFLGIGNKRYFRDINLEISRKWSNKFKTDATLLNIIYDRDVMENEGAPLYGSVFQNVIVMDAQYMFDNGHSLRGEFQHSWSVQDSAIIEPENMNGNWAHLLVEYTIAPSWYFTVYDQFNYGNDDPDRRIHYINGSIAYLTGTTRLQVGFGKQRGGIICVGGICRAVPASNGVFLSLTSTF